MEETIRENSPEMDYEKIKKELEQIDKVLEEELQREMAQRLSKADREWLLYYHQKQRLLTAGKESLAFWNGWNLRGKL